MTKVKDVLNYINSFAPFDFQPQWDNSGLLIGDENAEVKKAAFCLDLTRETLNNAINEKADLIVTHHPLIFKAQKRFLKGDLAYDTALSGINVISCHIPFDCAVGGVNDVLCDILEITDVTLAENELTAKPLMRIGKVKEQSSMEFAAFVSKKLDTVCGVVDCNNKISRVAVCGGSAMEYIDLALSLGADAFVTGEIKHHQALEVKEKGITVIAAGHFETENPSKYAMEEFIKSHFDDIETVILKQSNPLIFVDER